MKNAKKLIRILKIFILVTSFGFVFYKLLNEEQITRFEAVIINFSLKKYALLGFAVFLMYINWFSESYKWKLLIEKVERISLFKSFKAVLSGVTISLFTPNRTGEFAGRILSLERENRIQAIFPTFTGNIAQLIVTCIFGLIAVALLPLQFNAVFIDPVYTPVWISYASVFLILILVFIYFNLKLFEKPLNKIIFLKKYQPYYSYFFAFSRTQLLYFLAISMARYFVFTAQYIILTRIFDINIGLNEAIITIFLIYFVLTTIPTIALSEIGVRGSVSIFLIGKLSENLSGIFLASTSLWIINLAIPALIGSILIYRSKV